MSDASYGCPDCGELVDPCDHSIWQCQGRVCQQRDALQQQLAAAQARIAALEGIVAVRGLTALADEIASHKERIAALEADWETAKQVATEWRAHSDQQQERIAALEQAICTVLADGESQHPGGWGPDVTMLAVLREALKR